MTIGKTVKVLRKKAGLTQVELARQSDVGLRFLRELEQGKTTLRMDKVNAVLFMFSRTLGAVEMERGE